MKTTLSSLCLLLPLSLCAQTPSLDDLKKEAVADVESNRVMVQQIVNQVFSFSELGFQEVETSKYLTGILEKYGFHVEHGVAGIPTAWVATWTAPGGPKPVIGFITDVDCIPRASQKPGVAYHDPIIEGAPGHGEGHNSGQAVNIVAALALQKVMRAHKIAGTLKIYPGIAEELVGTKAFYVRAGLFKDVEIMLGVHVAHEFAVNYGQPEHNSGLVSVQYRFHGRAAHAAGAPWDGRSALKAAELMDVAWNYRREHLRQQVRVHSVIANGGDQPNVVPSEASIWYYYREVDYPHIRDLFDLGHKFSIAATMMTDTAVDEHVVGSAWPNHFNKVIAETQHKNIEMVGMPKWDEADQTLAKALQKEIGKKVEGLKDKVTPLETPKESTGGGSDDVGDISWNLPMTYLRYPANIPNLPGHAWENGVAMATPLAHKGSTAGAMVQAATALDFLTKPELITQAWTYFRDVQTKEIKYVPLIGKDDQPAIWLNKEKQDAFRPALQKVYYDPAKYKSYMEQLGIKYPTVKQ